MKGDIIDVDNEHVVIDLTEDVPLDLTTSKSLYEIAKNHWDALTRVEGNRPVFNAQPLTIYNSRSSIAPREIGNVAQGPTSTGIGFSQNAPIILMDDSDGSDAERKTPKRRRLPSESNDIQEITTLLLDRHSGTLPSANDEDRFMMVDDPVPPQATAKIPDQNFPPRLRSRFFDTINGFNKRISVLDTIYGRQIGLRRKLVTSGSVTRLAQDGHTLLVCSATSHGTIEEIFEDAYNHEGALVALRRGQELILNGHTRERQPTHRHLEQIQNQDAILQQLRQDQTDNSEAIKARKQELRDQLTVVKHYTVNHAAFDPTSSDRFVTTGYDCVVRAWEYEEDEEEYNEIEYGTYRFNDVPHEVAFKPSHPEFCVGEKDVYLFSSPTTLPTRLAFPAARKKQTIGSMVWGQPSTSTSEYIFASTEDNHEPPFGLGCHRAFDTRRGKFSYDFSAKEAGETMAINPEGGQLALVTLSSTSRAYIRVYDIARKDDKPRQQFVEDGLCGVNSAAYSPDGVYLALARPDNCVQVFDCRYLERGALYSFRHSGPSKASPGNDDFGVVHCEWVSPYGGALGLVTGGSDGCIKLWDPLASPENNGRTIAEVNADVATLSIGDRFKGEYDLVVGDGDGSVSIFCEEKGFAWYQDSYR